MQNWRSDTQPPLPIDIVYLVNVMTTAQWIQRLSYEVTIADKDAQTVETTTHNLSLWSAIDADGHTHVVIGSTEYAKRFENARYVFIDATFNVCPNIDGVYQLLTIMAEIGDSVSIIYFDCSH